MRNLRRVAWLLMVVVCASGATAASAATIYFQDGFENEPVSSASGVEPIGPPDVGVSWTESASSGAHGVDIVGEPNALGARSMRVLRESVPPFFGNGQANGLSIPGAIVDGNLLEVKWSNRLTTEGPTKHRFNGPMQMSIGHAGSNYDNDLAFISIGDPNGGSYAYTNSTAQFGNITSSTAQASLDAWDTVRAVLSLTQISPTQMGGTYDLFVSLGGAAEQQIANDAILGNTTIPALDPTSMQLRIGKGPSTAYIYYDDISVTQVPEPSVLGLGSVACGLLAVRRRRNRILV
jgi:hypothetical protein